jgi:hypothetical protein
MNKFLLAAIAIIAILAASYYFFTPRPSVEDVTAKITDPKKATYLIEGEEVKLGTSTVYFGNEIKTDLNGDGREDVAFIVTHSLGGSGTFYYAVAALNTEEGYVGSDGYFLGDRIAPQSTNLSPNPRHINVVVFNYADRDPSEPMTAQPSIAKSAYLKLDPSSMRWAMVVPDFVGESAF